MDQQIPYVYIMFKEQFKLAKITRFGCVSSTQNLCWKTILNVKTAIGLLVTSTNSCACSIRDLFAHITHISMCCSNKPLICVEPTNGVCEYGPRSPTNFFLLGQLILFNSVYQRSIKFDSRKKRWHSSLSVFVFFFICISCTIKIDHHFNW